jgi:hypothetical protein
LQEPSFNFDKWLEDRNTVKQQLIEVMYTYFMAGHLKYISQVKNVMKLVNKTYHRNLTAGEFHYTDFIADYLLELSVRERINNQVTSF